MKVADVISVPAKQGPYNLQGPVDFEDGQSCARIRLEFGFTAKNNNAAQQTLQLKNMISWLAAVLGSFTLGFGGSVRDVVDDAASWDDLTQMLYSLTKTKPRAKLSATSDWADIDPDSTASVAIASAASSEITVQITRSFEYGGFPGSKSMRWAPGAAQMRGLFLEMKKTTASAQISPDDSADLVVDGAITCTVILDTVEEASQQWQRPPYLFANNTDGKKHFGPPGGGAVLGAWEASASGPNTQLGLVSLRRKDGPELHSQVQASRIVSDAAFLAVDMSEVGVTPIFALNPHADLGDVPTSEQFEFIQHSLNVNPMKTRWLVVPPSDDGYAEHIVGPNVTSVASGNLSAKVAPAGSDSPIPANAVPVTGLSIATPDQPDFAVAPGQILRRNKGSIMHVPPPVVAAAKAAISAHGSDSQAKLRQIAKQVGRYIPGATSLGKNSGVVPPNLNVLLKMLSPSGADTSTAKAALTAPKASK